MSNPTLTASTVDEGDGGDLLATYVFAANLLADCPTFREVVIGVTDPEDAKAKVYFQETYAEADPDAAVEYEGDPQPELEARPFAILFGLQRTRRRAGVAEWAGEGRLGLAIEASLPDDLKIDYDQDGATEKRDKFRRRRRWGLEVAGKIEAEIAERSGGHNEAGDPFLNVHDFELAVEPADPAEGDDPNYLGWVYELSWK